MSAAGGPGADGRPDADDRDRVEGELVLGNEFTSVHVRKISTRNGEVLEIDSLRVDRSVRLDALVLESLTWRTDEDLAKGLETPFGGEAPRGEARDAERP